MTNKKKPLGLCPIGKFVFSHEEAVKYKGRIQKKLDELGIDYIHLDGVIEDGIVRSQEQVDTVIDYFSSNDIGSLFVPHCNFGTESAVGVIAKKLNVPTLLWGPRDDSPLPDGTRLRDTLCGLLASSKVLNTLGVPFSYIENCGIEEPVFASGVLDFYKGAHVYDLFKTGIRIGHIGQRIDFFWSTIVNESELLERFNIEILPLDMVEFITSAKEKARTDKDVYLDEISRLKTSMDIDDASEKAMANVLAVRDQMLLLGEKCRLDAFAIQDFMSLVDEMGSYCTYADSVVSEQYPMGYESDIHGAISDAILRRAALDTTPAFLTDITIRHPDNDNAVLLWHFGAPISMKADDARVQIGGHWILPSPLGGMMHFKLKEGPITILRFDSDRGNYKLALGTGHTVDGPDTRNNYAWMEVKNWRKWEEALIHGPFMHHVAMIYGDHSNAIINACKYLPNIELVNMD